MAWFFIQKLLEFLLKKSSQKNPPKKILPKNRPKKFFPKNSSKKNPRKIQKIPPKNPEKIQKIS